MQTDFVKATLMAAWVVAVGVLGYMSGTMSFAGWALLAVVSLMAPALMVRLWSLPSPTMSEAIREVIR
jgi:hypothetical protein